MKKTLIALLIGVLVNYLHAEVLSGTTLEISTPDKTWTKGTRLSADHFMMTWDESAGEYFLLLSPAPDKVQNKTKEELVAEWTKQLDELKNSLPEGYKVTKVKKLKRNFNVLNGYELNQSMTTDKNVKYIHSMFIFSVDAKVWFGQFRGDSKAYKQALIVLKNAKKKS